MGDLAVGCRLSTSGTGSDMKCPKLNKTKKSRLEPNIRCNLAWGAGPMDRP